MGHQDVQAQDIELMMDTHNETLQSCLAMCRAFSDPTVNLDGSKVCVAVMFKDKDAGVYNASLESHNVSELSGRYAARRDWFQTYSTPGPVGHCKLYSMCQPVADTSSDYVVHQLEQEVGFFQDRTCISGQTCSFDGILGQHLSSLDSFAVLDTCGARDDSESLVPKFAHYGWVESTTASGGSVSFGSTPVTASGGRYQLCWCGVHTPANKLVRVYESCSTPEQFRVNVGILTLVGPILDQDRTCVSGQTCAFGDILGTGLSPGDSIVIMDTCGVDLRETQVSALLPGATEEGFSVSIVSSGSRVSFGGVRLTASGGNYRLCWCSDVVGCGAMPSRYRMDMGRLTLIGPTSTAPPRHGDLREAHQDRTCVAGLTCYLDGLFGHHLNDQDTVLILDTCDGDMQYRLPNTGMSVRQTQSGASMDWGRVAFTSAGGQYRLCWCAGGFQCSLMSDYAVDVGALTVLGPTPLQQDRTCVAGQTCVVFAFTGYQGSVDPIEWSHGVLTGDGGRIKLLDMGTLWILDTCASHQSTPPIMNNGLLADLRAYPDVVAGGRESQGVADRGWSVSFGTQTISTPGGQYRICWCAEGYLCDTTIEFQVDVGEFSLIGPSVWGAVPREFRREFRGHCGHSRAISKAAQAQRTASGPDDSVLLYRTEAANVIL